MRISMRNIVLRSMFAILVLVAGAPAAPAQEGQHRIKEVKGDIWWREKPSATEKALRPNRDNLRILAPETQVRVNNGGQLTLTVVGANAEKGKLVLGPAADWVTLPKPPGTNPLIGGRSLVEIHRQFEKVQIEGGRKKGPCGKRIPLILAPACGVTTSAGRFEVRWTPESSRRFLNVELAAGGQRISASSPADTGSLKTQALTEFLRQVQLPSDPVGLTLNAQLLQGETVSITFNLMSRTEEIRFEQECDEAGRLDPIEAGIVRAALFERNGMWLESLTEYKELLTTSPQSSILLRKLADIGCVVGGTGMFRPYFDGLEPVDREGLLCEY
jgi:hypothetical protein